MLTELVLMHKLADKYQAWCTERGADPYEAVLVLLGRAPEESAYGLWNPSPMTHPEDFARALAASPSPDVWMVHNGMEEAIEEGQPRCLAITGNGPLSEYRAQFYAGAPYALAWLLREATRAEATL